MQGTGRSGGQCGFLKGTLTGFGLGVGLCLLVLAVFIHRGVTLRLEASALAQSLSVQAERRLQQNILALLGEAKVRVPDLVRPELHRRLAAAKIEFYGVSISVPPESLGGLEAYLVGVVEQTVGKLLDGFAAEIGAGSSRAPLEATLAEVLCEEFSGQVLTVSLPGSLSLPVTLVVE